MPCESQDDTVCICVHIIRIGIFVCKEFQILPAVLIRGLDNHMLTAVAKSDRSVLRSFGKLEIGVLTVQCSGDRHNHIVRPERALVDISRIDIHSRHRDDFKSGTQRVDIVLV